MSTCLTLAQCPPALADRRRSFPTPSAAAASCNRWLAATPATTPPPLDQPCCWSTARASSSTLPTLPTRTLTNRRARSAPSPSTRQAANSPSLPASLSAPARARGACWKTQRTSSFHGDFNSSTVTGKIIDVNAGVLNPLRNSPSNGFAAAGNPTWCAVSGRTQ